MIRVGEVGKTFRYGAGFDMSGSSALSLQFEHTDGTTVAVTATAPAAPVTDPDVGALAASEYFAYTTTGTDFTKAGTWTVTGVYEDATPKKYFTSKATFTVGVGL